MKQDLKNYISSMNEVNQKKHNFEINMHTINKEEYAGKLKSFYTNPLNVKEMLNISESCMFFDNESENKFCKFLLEKN